METSIFDNVTIRDPEKAFQNAIRKGMKNPEEYRYMESTKYKDWFKHYTGAYKSYFNFRDKLITMKEYKAMKTESKQ